jgi:hypothetical protein
VPRQASWAGYAGDSPAQLQHLLAAGDAAAAHDVFCAGVAPELFLEGSAASVARLSELAASLADVQGEIGPAWAGGGGAYHAWCRLFVRPDGGRGAGGGGGGGGGAWRRDVAGEAVAAGEGPAALEECCHLAQLLATAGQQLGQSAPPQRRAVLARMSDDVGAALARLVAASGGGAAPASLAAGATASLRQGCAVLGSHQTLVVAGLASELA